HSNGRERRAIRRIVGRQCRWRIGFSRKGRARHARACSKRVARRAIVEQPTRCSRTCARANLLALGLIEQRACIVDALGGNIEEQAVARLTENVAPVESFLPQLGVAHCHADGPERSDDKESAISENREWNKYR